MASSGSPPITSRYVASPAVTQEQLTPAHTVPKTSSSLTYSRRLAPSPSRTCSLSLRLSLPLPLVPLPLLRSHSCRLRHRRAALTSTLTSSRVANQRSPGLLTWVGIFHKGGVVSSVFTWGSTWSALATWSWATWAAPRLVYSYPYEQLAAHSERLRWGQAGQESVPATAIREINNGCTAWDYTRPACYCDCWPGGEPRAKGSALEPRWVDGWGRGASISVPPLIYARRTRGTTCMYYLSGRGLSPRRPGWAPSMCVHIPRGTCLQHVHGGRRGVICEAYTSMLPWQNGGRFFWLWLLLWQTSDVKTR